MTPRACCGYFPAQGPQFFSFTEHRAELCHWPTNKDRLAVPICVATVMTVSFKQMSHVAAEVYDNTNHLLWTGTCSRR